MSDNITSNQNYASRAVALIEDAEGAHRAEWSECSNKTLDLVRDADAEIEGLQRERDERLEWAAAWHRALQAVATALEVPSAGSDKMLVQDICAAIEKLRSHVETFARQPGDCKHERASVKCPDCGIDLVGRLEVKAPAPRSYLCDCDPKQVKVCNDSEKVTGKPPGYCRRQEVKASAPLPDIPARDEGETPEEYRKRLQLFGVHLPSENGKAQHE